MQPDQEATLLLLTRTRGQSIVIRGEGWEVEITVLGFEQGASEDVRASRVKLGVNAPRSALVLRRELQDSGRPAGSRASTEQADATDAEEVDALSLEVTPAPDSAG